MAVVLKPAVSHDIAFLVERHRGTLNVQVGNTAAESETRAYEVRKMIILRLLYLLHTMCQCVQFILNNIIYKYSLNCNTVRLNFAAHLAERAAHPLRNCALGCACIM
jgi:hypothetical protein